MKNQYYRNTYSTCLLLAVIPSLFVSLFVFLCLILLIFRLFLILFCLFVSAISFYPVLLFVHFFFLYNHYPLVLTVLSSYLLLPFMFLQSLSVIVLRISFLLTCYLGWKNNIIWNLGKQSIKIWTGPGYEQTACCSYWDIEAGNSLIAE